MPHLLLVLLAISSLVAACGADETYTGLGQGAIPGEPLFPHDAGASCPGRASCNCNCNCGAADAGGADAHEVEVASLAGNGYRLDSLHMTAPLTGEIGKLLNDYFAEQVAGDDLNILLLVEDDDRETGQLAMRIGAGKADNGGFELEGEGSQLLCTLKGDTFSTVEPAFLEFPNGLLTPPRLPISQLDVSGKFAADGAFISAGKLAGALSVEDAKQLKLAGADFYSLLSGFNTLPDLDADDDGEADSWLFTFDFAAVRFVQDENAGGAR